MYAKSVWGPTKIAECCYCFLVLPDVTDGDAFQDCTASRMKVKAHNKNAVAIPVRKISRNLIVFVFMRGQPSIP